MLVRDRLDSNLETRFLELRLVFIKKEEKIMTSMSGLTKKKYTIKVPFSIKRSLLGTLQQEKLRKFLFLLYPVKKTIPVLVRLSIRIPDE